MFKLGLKKNSFILFLLLFTIFATAQENGLQTKLVDETITKGKFSFEQLDSFYLNLAPIQTSTYKDHIRISRVGQRIDFYRSENEKYRGNLTNLTTEYRYTNEKGSNMGQRKAYQYLFEKIDLEQTSVDKMIQQLFISRQPEIPTDTLIPSWQYYLHCYSILFEFKLNDTYISQHFHCPWGQPDTVQFKKIIGDNLRSLESYFQLDSIYKNFENKLTKGRTYSNDGYRMKYIWTEEQNEAWKKDAPRRDYLKSVKDTIDNYLLTELKRQKNKLNGLDCFEEYNLYFDKKGKLKPISVHPRFQPQLHDGLGNYIEEKHGIRKCKRILRKLFKKINLRSFNLKYAVSRCISFDYKGEVELIDNTVY